MEPDAEGTFAEAMSVVAQLFEAIAAAVILSGLLWAVWMSWRSYRRSGSGEAAFKTMRRGFGGAILLGLEILVAGDLIRTVAVAPTLENAATLGIIVLIRTLLSVSLQIEMEGVLPWRRALVSGATIARQAHRDATGPPPGPAADTPAAG